MKTKLLILSSLLLISLSIAAQGYLHADGKRIVDGNNENFIIRSIGTGNWLIMEGYMMNSSGDAGTHTGFRNKLIETIGVANTDSFFTKWNHDHMRKVDIDSMAAWGFNTVRVAMHYKWLTLPIEDEPVLGEQTWLEPGFVILDSLLSWCTANSMYLILDMHGAPGGQGKESGISDYDPALLSLWESDDNKTKLVLLWQKLAERYSDEPWMGGYDLINETNWVFTEGNNSKMRELYGRITDSIRSVDQNHIIFIEGNWFANDFSGLTPPWDDNMAYSFHKYWGYNNENSLDWVLPLRDEHNVPVWCGETGENSNTWFTNAVRLYENNNVGWSFWPVKKVGINNVLKSSQNPGYTALMDYWNGNGPEISQEDAFQAVLDFSENHRFEKCKINYDVIDAIIRQPHTTELSTLKIAQVEDTIYAVDYALGRNGYAYFDQDTADYHLDTGEYEKWNNGWAYRNDGVDIELSRDEGVSNVYSVGWTNDGEWLVYLLHTDLATVYDCIVRTASGSSGGDIVFEANGNVISNEYALAGTGDWYNWQSDTLKDILLPAGDIELKIRFTNSGSNFNFFRFINPRPADAVEFESLLCETSILGNDIYIHVNREITAQEMTVYDFKLFVNSNEIEIDSVYVSEESNQLIVLKSAESIIYSRTIKVSYNGSSVHSNAKDLLNFEEKPVRNSFMEHKSVPGKVEAEDYLVNVGFALEDCKDSGGGENTAWANPGDYLDYLVYVPESQEWQIDFRLASAHSSFQLTLEYENDGVFIPLKTVSFTGTGDWQTWETQSTLVDLVKGKYIFRIKSKQGEYNMNWFQFLEPTGVESELLDDFIKVYPNPAGDFLTIDFTGAQPDLRNIEIYSMKGALIWKRSTSESNLVINISEFSSGTYFLKVLEEGKILHQKIMVY
jgi:endoglucanase